MSGDVSVRAADRVAIRNKMFFMRIFVPLGVHSVSVGKFHPKTLDRQESNMFTCNDKIKFV